MGYTDSRVVLDNMDLLGQVSVESYIIFMGTLFFLGFHLSWRLIIEIAI
jgi:hypothetical protein